MRYVISDIHGEYDLFLKLLEKIKFSKEDTLFVCGDIIEKGQNSIKLAKLISQMPNVKCIVGNHEYAFLKYYWGLVKGYKLSSDALLGKLQEYFPEDGYLLDYGLVDWFESLPFYIEEDDFICVHAGLPLDGNGHILPIENAIPEQLVYDRTFKGKSIIVRGGKCVFFGHTPTSYILNGDSKIIAYLKPNRKGDSISDYYKVHLDLGTWMSGTLGCFCIDTCKCFYVKK